MERANQTLQDRLIKEMRLTGIDDMESANAWLPGYIEDYNRRFAVIPKDLSDAHSVYSETADILRRTATPALRGEDTSGCRVEFPILPIKAYNCFF